MVALIFTVAGALLVLVALTGSIFKRLPLSTSLIYLTIGCLLGGMLLPTIQPLAHARLLEHVTEVAVIVSLFSSGLKLRLPLRHRAWRVPVRLASGAMILTVAIITVIGVLLLNLPLGAALLLGGILAPTDPVLASDVQVENASDQDRLRFGLTGEAGLNDGTAFPFVMLGLGLLGHHELGALGWKWLAVDVLWSVTGGLGIGWTLGALVGRLVVYLRRVHKEAVGLDDFLALGLIALSYGVALVAHSYGFLAIFAAGVALRRTEARNSGERAPPDVKAAAANKDEEHVATRAETAHAYMAQAVLGVTEQLERMVEVGLMVLVGWLLVAMRIPLDGILLAALLLVVVRPISVAAVTTHAGVTSVQSRLMCWFGIRGIGSLYYFFFAANHGLSDDLGRRLLPLTVTVIAVSAVVHGTSVTPLMHWYARRKRRGDRATSLPSTGTSP